MHVRKSTIRSERAAALKKAHRLVTGALVAILSSGCATLNAGMSADAIQLKLNREFSFGMTPQEVGEKVEMMGARSFGFRWLRPEEREEYRAAGCLVARLQPVIISPLVVGEANAIFYFDDKPALIRTRVAKWATGP